MKLCLYCAGPFEENIDQKKHIYCCVSHQKLAWKKAHPEIARAWQRKKWKKEHPLTIIYKICVTCFKEFTPDARHKYQKYCSIYCRNKFSTTPERKQIWRKTYRDNNLEKIKEKDYQYKARVRFGATSKTLNKEIVIKRDKGICKLCEIPFQVIHHIRYSGKVEDLVLLCRSCHASIHQRIKKEPYWNGYYNFEENTYSKE